jgi:hypothetical protein
MTSWGDFFVEDYFSQDVDGVVSIVSKREMEAIAIRKVDDDEETSEEEYNCVEKVQRIYKDTSQDEAVKQEEIRRTLGHGTRWGYILLHEQIPQLPGKVPVESGRGMEQQ